MNIIELIKNVFKKKDKSENIICIVQRNTDGKYAVRMAKPDGDMWYMKFHHHDSDTGNATVSWDPSCDWVFHKYQHEYENNPHYRLWTTDIDGLISYMSYKETVVDISARVNSHG